ncbi:O-antigen ligase family protein [Sphingorhabdus sp.]|uniref:O-antigen ligase family protein n=1 Tax=Sphingorhabdus sp. TaxID=1902408 RepID=UPI00391991C4
MRALTNIGSREVSFRFWLFILFVFFIVFTGGSSRADAQSLAIVRPTALVVCGFALWTISREHLLQYRMPISLMFAALALQLFHISPFSSMFSTDTPTEQIMSAVNLELGVSSGLRPLALVPDSTMNAIFSLAVPFAALLLGCQLTRSERALLLPIMLIIGFFSGVWGLLQVTGGSQNSLYLYALTNDGAAVGLFANRNHQATLLACMFPMLAAYATMGEGTAEKLKVKGWAAAAVAIFLVPLILVTGSRTGVILSIIGIAFAAVIYRKPQPSQASKRKIRNPWPLYAAVGLAVTSLGAITLILSRAQALSRFTSRAPADELRFQIWGPITKFAADYLPFGSGGGSFAMTYQVYEPERLLMASHVNQVHNDFIDVFLTAGIPGIIIVLLSLVVVAKAGFNAFSGLRIDSQSKELAKTGLAIFTILAAASMTDYPLRVPSLSAFMSISLLWLFGIQRRTKEKAGTN